MQYTRSTYAVETTIIQFRTPLGRCKHRYTASRQNKHTCNQQALQVISDPTFMLQRPASATSNVVKMFMGTTPKSGNCKCDCNSCSVPDITKQGPVHPHPLLHAQKAQCTHGLLIAVPQKETHKWLLTCIIDTNHSEPCVVSQAHRQITVK